MTGSASNPEDRQRELDCFVASLLAMTIQQKVILELAIPIAAPPGPAGAYIHSKSAAQQKLFSSAVVFELGSRAAAVVGRLRRRPHSRGGECRKHGSNGGGRRNQRRAACAAMDGVEFSHRLMPSIIRRQTSAGL